MKKEIIVGNSQNIMELIASSFALQFRNLATISVVAYEHHEGIPARFCAGLIPALKLADSSELKDHFLVKIRVVDPTPIVNHCNGWSSSSSRVREIVTRFLHECYPKGRSAPPLFFDEAEPVSDPMLAVLRELGTELESADGGVRRVVGQIKGSGRRHGGATGEKNALLYMAAHPFSWSNFYHPAVWKRAPLPPRQYINLISRSEEPFLCVRRFLARRRPDFLSKVRPIDRCMTVCAAPAYIPLPGEPSYEDLSAKGYEACLAEYRALRGRDYQHERAYRDFELMMKFVHSTTGVE